MGDHRIYRPKLRGKQNESNPAGMAFKYKNVQNSSLGSAWDKRTRSRGWKKMGISLNAIETKTQ